MHIIKGNYKVLLTKMIIWMFPDKYESMQLSVFYSYTINPNDSDLLASIHMSPHRSCTLTPTVCVLWTNRAHQRRTLSIKAL